MRKAVLLLFVGILFVSGCGTTKVYKEILIDKPAYNSKGFPVPADILYDALLKTILSKSFIIDQSDKGNGTIVATRHFQKGKKTIILELQARIMAQEEDGCRQQAKMGQK